MKERLRIFGTMGAFWIGFFVISRILFLVYHADQTAELSLRDIGTIMVLGLRMDLAMSSYWLILTGLLLTVPFLPAHIVFYVHYAFTMVLLLISAVIVVVDLELYTHWGFRMNTTPLFYFSTEAVGSVNPGHAVVLVLILVTLLFAGWKIYQRFISQRLLALASQRWQNAPVMLLMTALLFLPIRSSISVAPLNVGDVYFHKTKAFPNHAGINVVWNFFNTFSAKDKIRYPSDFFAGDAASVLLKMQHAAGPVPSVLRTRQPNVILILLESFTAKIMEPLGGLNGITPNLNALTREGILFDQFYASGDRTDKGLLAVLSSYPAQPKTSLIRFPHKTQNLPFLSKALARHGYHTSFLYGGDLGFANMEAYLTTAGFSHLTQDDDFASSLDNSKWGVADHYVFERLRQEADTARNPFFKVMLSLSSHEPFEVPMKPVIPGNDERALFLNACLYTDKSLGDFIAQAKKSAWWDNTLIIVTADHGHRFPDPAELKDKNRFRIPMLWLGGALLARDTVVHTLGGQTDLASTLLEQLGITPAGFTFSKDLLNPGVKPYAVYTFQNGFGYLDPHTEYIYDFDVNKYILGSGKTEDVLFGNAYMQVLFDDYNSR